MESLGLSEDEIEQFNKDGYLGPYPLIEPGKIELVIRQCYSNYPTILLPHLLARHTVVKEVAELGLRLTIISKIVSL
jgi:hypothetical protein